jgi:hypothetical protein
MVIRRIGTSLNRARDGWTARAGLLCTFALIAATPCLAGEAYKWVDEQGQVHYSDTPPAGTAYEIVPGPPHPPVTPRSATPSASVAPEPAPAREAQRVGVPAPTPAADDGKCVDALYQIALLSEKRRVFKPGPGGTREYIDDADRPAEIERLSRERDENCSNDPETRKSQDVRADRLMEALSPDCQSAREKLLDMQSPSTRTPPSEIERQRVYLEEHCPGPDRTDLWMADWMFVNLRKPRSGD